MRITSPRVSIVVLVTAPPDDPPDSSSAARKTAVADAVDAEGPPQSGPRQTRAAEELARFLWSRDRREGQSFIRGVIVVRLYGDAPDPKDVDERLVDNIASDAWTRAVNSKSPPLFVPAVRRWVARVTVCAIADHFRHDEKDRAWLDRAFDVLGWTDRHAPGTDWGAREHLICKWLERQLGDDPRKRETFLMMVKHNVQGFSLKDLAQEFHTTEKAIERRIHKLRKELAPKVAVMDREKPRRAILFFFLPAVVAVAIALILWWLLGPAARPPVPPHVAPLPSATASAEPAPSFDQAQPTNDLAAPADASTAKPGGGRK